jgi:uncharacterized membrane protein
VRTFDGVKELIRMRDATIAGLIILFIGIIFIVMGISLVFSMSFFAGFILALIGFPMLLAGISISVSTTAGLWMVKETAKAAAKGIKEGAREAGRESGESEKKVLRLRAVGAREEHDEDPLKILKLRLAKGEITKKQYEKMKKTVEE